MSSPATPASSPRTATEPTQPPPETSSTLPAPQAEGAEAAEMADAAPSDDSDDEVADFRNLLPQLIADRDASKKSSGLEGAAANISIPKRGEKDFEPTGFKGQEKKLEESRRAMEMVIGQKRRTPNKTMSVAVWHPELKRAILDVSKGTTISSMGVTARHPVTVSSPSEIPSTSSDTIGPGNQVGVWKAGIFYPRYTSRVELLPEESLFLMERGTLECRLPTKLSDSEEEAFIPLSLQHAFSLMLGKDGCNRERYQVYAYLKRLGYYVQRCSVADALRASAAAAKKKELADDDHHIPTPADKLKPEGIVADPRRPLRLVSLFDLLLYIPRRIAQALASGTSALIAWIMRVAGRVGQSLRSSRPSVTTRSSNATAPRTGPATGLLGINAQQLSSYDSLYSALQIIPSGHDLPPAKPRVTSSADSKSTRTGDSDPFLPFFYAWRPATHFRKTNPPLPEFRVAVTSARDTHLPKLHQFQAMFDAVPLPDAAPTGASEGDEEERKRAAAEKKRNDESYGRGFAARKKRDELAAARLRKKQGGAGEADDAKRSEKSQASPAPLRLFAFLVALLPEAASTAVARYASAAHRLLLLLSQYFSHLPPGTACIGNGGRQNAQHGRGGGRFGGGAGGGGPRRPNPFPPLKGGRRNVILAVVDHGTTSLLRFGEAEFAKWKLMGSD